MVSGFFALSKVEIHLCRSVNAKKIVVAVSGKTRSGVVRVIEVFQIVGGRWTVVATI